MYNLITTQNCDETAAGCVTYITLYATMMSFTIDDDIGHAGRILKSGITLLSAYFFKGGIDER